MSGSPPAIETIGAPHSSIAPIAWSTGMRRRSSCSGCWILPQPSQARLHWKSGSSSTISGDFSTRLSFCFIRYAPMCAACLIGTAMSRTPSAYFGGQFENGGLGRDAALADVQLAQAAEGPEQVVHERLG